MCAYILVLPARIAYKPVHHVRLNIHEALKVPPKRYQV